MADENEPKKGGFTVGEIEGKMRKYGLEISLCVMFVLTAIFLNIWGGSMLFWAILLSMLCAIVGVLVPKAVHKAMSQALRFVYREKVTAIVVVVVGILLSIFFPVITLGLVGLFAGKAFALDANMQNGGN